MDLMTYQKTNISWLWWAKINRVCSHPWVLVVVNQLFFPHIAFQMVESSDLWKLHDLFNNEKGVLDEIRLVPDEMDTALCVKRQQFSMHCDALKGIKLVKYFRVKDVSTLTTSEISLTSISTAIRNLQSIWFWLLEKARESSRNRNECKSYWYWHYSCYNLMVIILVLKLLCALTFLCGKHYYELVFFRWLLQLDETGTVFYSTAPKWISCPSSVEGLNSSISRE